MVPSETGAKEPEGLAGVVGVLAVSQHRCSEWYCCCGKALVLRFDSGDLSVSNCKGKPQLFTPPLGAFTKRVEFA